MENFKTLGLMTTFMVSILRYDFKKVASSLHGLHTVLLLCACCSILYKLKSRLECDCKNPSNRTTLYACAC